MALRERANHENVAQSGSIPIGRVANLVGDIPLPAFSGLASRLASVIADGLLPLDSDCPANVTWPRRWDSPGRPDQGLRKPLREAGYAAARQGSGHLDAGL